MATKGGETTKGEPLPYAHLQPGSCPIVPQSRTSQVTETIDGSKETPGKSYDHLQPTSVSRCPIVPSKEPPKTSDETPGNPYAHLQPAAQCPVVCQSSGPPILSSSDLTGRRVPVLRSQDLWRASHKESSASQTFGGCTETSGEASMEDKVEVGSTLPLSERAGVAQISKVPPCNVGVQHGARSWMDDPRRFKVAKRVPVKITSRVQIPVKSLEECAQYDDSLPKDLPPPQALPVKVDAPRRQRPSIRPQREDEALPSLPRPRKGKTFSPYIRPGVIAKPADPCRMDPIVPVYPRPVISEIKHYSSNMRYGYNGIKSRASYPKPTP